MPRSGLFLLFLAAGCQPERAPGPTDPGAVLDLLRPRIETRKTAASQGDSTAWLTAARLHPQATCVDATGSKRPCRPDFGNPSHWEQRVALDSMVLNLIHDVAIVTYRETDTVVVAGNLGSGQARYVETYIFADGMWQLAALTEVLLPEPRIPRTVSAAALRSVVGSYGTSAYSLNVTLTDETLFIGATGEPAETLWALSPDRYFVRGDAGTYEFTMTDSRSAAELRYRMQGQTYRFVRRE